MSGELFALVHKVGHSDSTTSVSDAEDQFKKLRDHCINIRDAYAQNNQVPLSVECRHTHTDWVREVQGFSVDVKSVMQVHTSTKSDTFRTEVSTFEGTTSVPGQCEVWKQYRLGPEGRVSVNLDRCEDITLQNIEKLCAEAVAKQMATVSGEVVRTIDTCASYR